MEALFIELLNRSILASWLVLAVILLRFLLKKAPKRTRCILWALVGVRLVCPFSFESFLSLIPSAETISPDILYSREPAVDSGIGFVNSVVNPAIAQSSLRPNPVASVNPIQIIAYLASIVWMIGIALLLLYSLISYVRLRRKVMTAVWLRDNIWQSEGVFSPFVLGLFRPRIYLPFHVGERDLNYVIAHEAAHISRRDHWIKLCGFLLLTIYWFNPFLWLAYSLLCRDIELSCDERVILELGADEKKAYSLALLECSTGRKRVAACPLAFGEVGVKQRVKNILNYKKPAFWISVLALVSCVVTAACFLTNPKVHKTPEASIAGVLGLAEKNVTIFGSYETWEDGWYILGFLAGQKRGDSKLGAALFHLEDGKYTMESYYCPKDGISQDKTVVCSFCKTPSVYDVILSRDEELARIEYTVKGVTDSSSITGIPGMVVIRYPDTEYSAVSYRFYGKSGTRVGEYASDNTSLILGEYEPKEVISLASWSSSTKEYFLEKNSGTKFLISLDQFKDITGDAASAELRENTFYKNPQYVAADVGDKIELMSSTGETKTEPMTLDVSAYSSKICYEVLSSDGKDTGYRIFYMDGQIWIGHWGWYGTKKNGWWCEYIFKVGLSGAGS